MMATQVKCFLEPLELHLTVTHGKWICSDRGKNKGGKGLDWQVNLKDRLLACPDVRLPGTWTDWREAGRFRRANEVFFKIT